MEPTGSESVVVENNKKFQLSKLPVIPVIVSVIALLIIVGVIFLLRPQTKTLIQKATTQMATGNYDAAGNTYKTILKNDKNNLTALNGIISANSLQGNQDGKEIQQLQDSKPYIDRAMEMYSGDPLTLQNVGYAYETAGDYEKALDLYSKATKIDPNSSDAWFHKGHALYFLNRETEAREAYDKAYTLNSNNPLVLIVKANSFAKEGNNKTAGNMYLIASKNAALSPSIRAEALTAASNSHRLQAGGNSNSPEMDEALRLSKQAVETSPDFAPALGTYGINLAITGEKEKGIEYIKKAITENSRISRNYFLLAYVLRSEKKYTETVKLLNEALGKIENDNTLVGETNKSLERGMYLYELAKTYSMGKIQANLIPILQESIKLNPDMQSKLKSDYQKYGVFSELNGNQTFLNMINN